jgi:hypothetical protein
MNVPHQTKKMGNPKSTTQTEISEIFQLAFFPSFSLDGADDAIP